MGVLDERDSTDDDNCDSNESEISAPTGVEVASGGSSLPRGVKTSTEDAAKKVVVSWTINNLCMGDLVDYFGVFSACEPIDWTTKGNVHYVELAFESADKAQTVRQHRGPHIVAGVQVLVV